MDLRIYMYPRVRVTGKGLSLPGHSSFRNSVYKTPMSLAPVNEPQQPLHGYENLDSVRAYWVDSLWASYNIMYRSELLTRFFAFS